MKIRPWNLKEGDKTIHGEETLTFIGMDGMYAHWLDEKGELRAGHADWYEFNEQTGVYLPINE